MPKVYFFDTGFMTFFHGVTELHPKEKGLYWEHLVLNELLTFIDREFIHIWRDKAKNEVDFVIKLRGKHPMAIECKLNHKEFFSDGLRKFRDLHPKGKNFLISADVTTNRNKKIGDLDINIIPLERMREFLKP